MRARTAVFMGLLGVCPVLGACDGQSGATVHPGADPVVDTTASADADPMPATADVAGRLRLEFEGEARAFWAAVRPVSCGDCGGDEWYGDDGDGYTFALAGAGAYDVKVSFHADAGDEQRRLSILTRPGVDEVTLRFVDGQTKPGTFDWGWVWPTEAAIALTRQGLEDVPDLGGGLAARVRAHEDHALDHQVKAQLIEAQHRSRARIEAEPDPTVRALASIHHLRTFAAYEVMLRMELDDMSWVIDEVPLDHPLWVSRPAELLVAIHHVELEKAWPALTQLRRASPYPGQRKVALVGEASLSASAGMPFAYDEVLEALTRS